jgi:hypothetical protein
VMRVCENGSRVYFVSTGVYSSNRDAKGETAQSGMDNMYLYNTVTNQYVFVAALSPSDDIDWSEDDEKRDAEATFDGGFLLFASRGDLTPDASGSGVQLYRFDAEAGEEKARTEAEGRSDATGSLVRVTIGNDGYNADGNAPAQVTEFPLQSFWGESVAHPPVLSMSEDGSEVFFTSSLALTPQAALLNNVCAQNSTECYPAGPGWVRNVYEYEDGHVYLISDGQDEQSVFEGSTTELFGTTPSGDDVIFQTADSLVPQDGDTQIDIYDARVDGGFPGPSGSRCEGEACLGPVQGAPAFSTPGSTAFSGSGNPAPALAQQPASTVKPPAQAHKRKKAKAKKCRVKRKHRLCKAPRARKRPAAASVRVRRGGK